MSAYVQISTPNGTQSLNISSLAPGQIHSFPVTISLKPDGSPVTISTSVQITEQDKDTSNNSRHTEFSSQPES